MPTNYTNKKRWIHSRFVGTVMILAAVLGWIISLTGLAAVWYFRPWAIHTTQEGAKVLVNTLLATDNLLSVMDDTLTQINTSMATVQNGATEISDTLGNMTAIASTTSGMLDEEIPQVLSTTTTSLESLESTALLIDNTLTFISSVPLIGGSQYKPEVPLNESVKDIKNSLEDLPVTIKEINTQLQGASSSLENIQKSVESLSTQLTELQTNLGLAQDVVKRYRVIIGNLQPLAQNLESKSPLGITILAGIASLFGVWLALVQLGLYTQGMERLTPPLAVEG